MDVYQILQSISGKKKNNYFFALLYNYRRLPILEETASEIQKVTGNKVLALQCDVRDPEAIKNAGIFLNKIQGPIIYFLDGRSQSRHKP